MSLVSWATTIQPPWLSSCVLVSRPLLLVSPVDMLPHLKPCPIFPTRGHLCLHSHPLLSLTMDNLPDLLLKPNSQLGRAASSSTLLFLWFVFCSPGLWSNSGVHLTACHSVILTSSSSPSYLSSGGPYQRGHPTQLLPYSVIFTLRLNRHWALSLLLTCSFSYLPHSFLTGPDSFAPFFILHSPPMCRVCWPCLGNIVTI